MTSQSDKTESKQKTQQKQPDDDAKKAEPLRFAEKVEQLQSELEAAQAKLTEAEQKAEDNWQKALRTLAELDNVRKRSEKDVSNAHKYAVEKFANGLLPVIDSLEKALETQSEQPEAIAIKQGVELTLKMFVDTVAKFGLEQLNPVGEVFDPEFHEAMSMIEDPNYDSNIVMQVYQVGYRLNGRLVRPARVVVSQ